MPGFKHVPYNNLQAVERAIDSRTCAVLVEPVQGEGGVNVPGDDYLPGLRRLCDEAGILLILDEVQSGMGRTGRLFAYQHWGVEPDILTLAKALAGGVPMGAMLAREAVAASFVPGTHASTFGGTPFVSAVALAVVRTMLEDDLPGNAARVGKYFLDRLEALKADAPRGHRGAGEGPDPGCGGVGPGAQHRRRLHGAGTPGPDRRRQRGAVRPAPDRDRGRRGSGRGDRGGGADGARHGNAN